MTFSDPDPTFHIFGSKSGSDLGKVSDPDPDPTWSLFPMLPNYSPSNVVYLSISDPDPDPN
jgi:hypothetical protein